MRVAFLSLCLLWLAAALSGCSTTPGRAAQQSATEFTRAVAASHGAAACALLAPGAQSEIEQSSGQGCAKAVLSEHLPRPGPVVSSAEFGTMSRVVFAHDVMFLAEFRSGWRVLAAGCSPVPGHPYDCTLKGD
jgi:hypothetical protein